MRLTKCVTQDVATDHTLVGCSNAVLEPGKQDLTSHADMPDDWDGTRWSSIGKDVTMDHTLIGCNSSVQVPGEQDRTSHADMPDALDDTRWSSTEKGYWWNDTRGYIPQRVNKKWSTFSRGKRSWWCYDWHYDYNSRASEKYNDKRWYDSGRVAREQWRSGRPGNSEEVRVCVNCKCNQYDLNERGLTLRVILEGWS